MSEIYRGWYDKARPSWFSDSGLATNFSVAPPVTDAAALDIFGDATGYTGAMSSDVGGFSTDPAGDRALQSAQDTGIQAAKAGLLRGLTNAGVYTAVEGSPNYASAFNSFKSAFNPVSLATTGLGGILANSMGLESNAKYSLGSSLLGMALGNPAIGIFGGILGPVANEGIGKLTGTRKKEDLKKAIEKVYDSDFLSTAKLTRDISDYADSYGKIKRDHWLSEVTDPITGETSYESNYGELSPEEASLNNLHELSSNIMSQYNASQPYGILSDPTNPSSYNENIAAIASSINEGLPDTVPSNLHLSTEMTTPLGSTISAYRDATGAANSLGWSGNVNSAVNPGGFNAAAQRAGISISGIPAGTYKDAVKAFNLAGTATEGVAGAVANISRQNALASVGTSTTAAPAADTSGDTASDTGSAGRTGSSDNGGFGSPSSQGRGTMSGYGEHEGSPVTAASNMTGTPAGGGTTSGGARVICSELVRQGLMSKRLLRYEELYTIRNAPKYVIRGYHFWAVPVTRWMQKYAWVTKLAKMYIWRAEEIAYKMGKRKKGNWKGKIIRAIFEPLCYILGPFVKYDKVDKKWDRKDSERLLYKGNKNG